MIERSEIERFEIGAPKCKKASIFMLAYHIFYGAQEGTRTPTKLLAST